MEVEVIQGWICPICSRGYPEKQSAQNCLESHDEVYLDPFMEVGDIFPVEIIARRRRRGKIIEILAYKPEGEPHPIIE